MGLFTPTLEGFNKGKLVTPGVWYPAEIVKCEEGTGKDSGAAYTRVHFSITAGEFKDIQVNQIFSEKWMEAVGPFIAAVTGEDYNRDFEKKIAGQAIDINDKNFKGRKLELFIVRGKYKDKNGKERDQNQIEGFRPAGKAA